jgi:hypothetical protein
MRSVAAVEAVDIRGAIRVDSAIFRGHFAEQSYPQAIQRLMHIFRTARMMHTIVSRSTMPRLTD